MRDSHRAEAEGLLRRAVEEEVRRSGGRTDGNVLLSRARAALDAMAGTAGEEYSAYTHALDEAAAGSPRAPPWPQASQGPFRPIPGSFPGCARVKCPATRRPWGGGSAPAGKIDEFRS